MCIDEVADDVDIQKIIDETIRNGFGSVLRIPQSAETRYETLIDVAQEKVNHPKNNYYNLDLAMILAILIYTGTEVQGEFRNDMVKPGFTAKWKHLAQAIYVAVRQKNRIPRPWQLQVEYLRKYEPLTDATTVYHGLHNVHLNNLQFIQGEDWVSDSFFIAAPISTSLNVAVAVQFACGDEETCENNGSLGILLEISLEGEHGVDAAGMDVSWISKFSSEEEVLLSPYTCFGLELKPASEDLESETRYSKFPSKQAVLEEMVSQGRVRYEIFDVNGKEAVLGVLQVFARCIDIHGEFKYSALCSFYNYTPVDVTELR